MKTLTSHVLPLKSYAEIDSNVKAGANMSSGWRKFVCGVSVVFLLLTFSFSAEAATRYVSQGASGNGATASTPSGDLAAMITASEDADEIRISAGDFAGAMTDAAAFLIPAGKGLTISGGWDPAFEVKNSNFYQTRLTRTTGTRRVLSVEARSTLEGLYIIGGNGNGDGGGGVLVAGEGTMIRNCQITGNTAAGFGGGIHAKVSMTISHCDISGNWTTATKAGGGIAAQTAGTVVNIDNSIVANNTSTHHSGGIMFDTGARGVVRNSTIVKNTLYGSNYGGGVGGAGNGASTYYNCIIWGNGGNSAEFRQIWDGTYGYCAIQEIASQTSGTKTNCLNLDTDNSNAQGPKFVSSSTTVGSGGYLPAANWRLYGESICVNAGDNEHAVSPDMDGVTRPQSETADIGAYEFNGNLYPVLGNILYVKADASGTGKSWQDAGNLKTVLASAKKGYEVWVAAGVYELEADEYGGGWRIPSGVHVYGAFAGGEAKVGDRELRAGGRAWDFVNETILSPKDNSGRGVYFSNVVNVVLDGLIIRDGNISGQPGLNGGAGILCENATGVIRRCIIRDNTNGSGAGGGISIKGDNSAVTVEQSLIANNIANANGGGGIFVEGGANSVLECFVVNNDVNGGTGSDNQGAGIRFLSGKNSAVNCLIANNTAEKAGGGINGVGGQRFTNCTVVNNKAPMDAGLYQSDCYFTNVISSGNVTGNAPTGNVSGLMGCAIEGTNPNCTMAELFVSPTTFNGADKTKLDQILSADFSLKSTAYAVNSGSSVSGVNTDVTGIARPQWGTFDIGAFEYAGEVEPPYKKSVLYVRLGGTGDGSSWTNAIGSIQQAVDSADQTTEIWVAAGTYVNSDQIIFKNTCGIYGGFPASGGEWSTRMPSVNKTILTRSGNGRVLNVQDVGYWRTIDGLIITGGQLTDDVGGAGIFVRAKTKIVNCIIENNHHNINGAGVYVYASEVVIENTIIRYNKTAGDGAGGMAILGNTEMINCRVYGNEGGFNGGGIRVSGGTNYIRNSLFYNNYGGFGGCIRIEGGTSYFINSTFTRNNCYRADGGSVIGQYGGGSAVIRNSICYQNMTNGTDNSGMFVGSCSVYNTAYYTTNGGNYTGNGNISEITNPGWVPSFVKAPTFHAKGRDNYTAAEKAELNAVDLSVLPTSICIDKGGLTDIPATDIVGAPRICGSAPDMGAYEYTGSVQSPMSPMDQKLFVSAGGRGLMDGSSWRNAASGRRLQEAINHAGAVEIHAEAGSYVNSGLGTDAAFIVPGGKKLIGGYAADGSGMWNSKGEKTVLSPTPGSTLRVMKIEASVTLKGVMLSGAKTTVNGAGLHISGVNTIVEDCIIANNVTTGSGGLYVGANGTMVRNTIVANNSSDGEGGGIYAGAGGKYINCIVANNYSPAWGGAGAFNGKDATNGSNLYNCTFVNNKCKTDGSGEFFSSSGGNLYNCVAWNLGNTASPNGNYNFVNGAVTFGANRGSAYVLATDNTSATAPKFVNPSTTLGLDANWAAYDYRLASTSVCIDMGAEQPLANQDINGVTRPQFVGGGYDVGAYEYIYGVGSKVALNLAKIDGKEPLTISVTLQSPNFSGGPIQVGLRYSCANATGDTSFLLEPPLFLSIPNGAVSGSATCAVGGASSEQAGILTVSAVSAARSSQVVGTVSATTEVVTNADIPVPDENGYFLLYNETHLSWFAKQVNTANPAMKGKIAADISIQKAENLPMKSFSGILSGVYGEDGSQYRVTVDTIAYNRMFETVEASAVIGDFILVYAYEKLNAPNAGMFIQTMNGTLRNFNHIQDARWNVDGTAGLIRQGGGTLQNCTARITENGRIQGKDGYAVGVFFGDLTAPTTIDSCTVYLDGSVSAGAGGVGGTMIGSCDNVVTLKNCVTIVGSNTAVIEGVTRGGLIGRFTTPGVPSTVENSWYIYPEVNTNVPAGGIGSHVLSGIYRVVLRDEYPVLPLSPFSLISLYPSGTTAGILMSSVQGTTDAESFATGIDGYASLLPRTKNTNYTPTLRITPVKPVNADLTFKIKVKSSDVLEVAEDKTVEIKSDAQLQELSILCDKLNSMEGLTFVLKGNVKTGSGFKPVGQRLAPFGGSFIGEKIDGLPIYTVTLNGDIAGQDAGLFGFIKDPGRIESIKVVLDTAATITGNDFAGTLAGYADAPIVNCDVDVFGKVVVGNSNGTDADYRSAGGLVGRIFGGKDSARKIRIQNCKVHVYRGAAIQVSGSVTTGRCAGGLFGYSFQAPTDRNVVIVDDGVTMDAPAGGGTVMIGRYAGRLQDGCAVTMSYLVTDRLGTYNVLVAIGNETGSAVPELMKMEYGVLTMYSTVPYELSNPPLWNKYHGRITCSRPEIQVTDSFTLQTDIVGVYMNTNLIFESTDVKQFTLNYDIAVHPNTGNKVTFVTSEGGKEIQDGGSWNTAIPFNRLKGAMDAAAATGNSVWVTSGTFNEALTITVPIYGGFQGVDGETAETRARKDLNNDGVISPWEFEFPTIIQKADAEPVVTVNSGGIVDGFTIQKGFRGANVNAGATLRNSIVQDNVGPSRGGSANGVQIAGSNSLVDACLIVNNTYTTGGQEAAGGLATTGNNVSNRVVRNSMIIGNRGPRVGGIYISYGGAGLAVYNTVIANNYGDGFASNGAGGIGNHQFGDGAQFYNCTVVNNKAVGTDPRCAGISGANYYGGFSIYNCIVYGNQNDAGPSESIYYTHNASPLVCYPLNGTNCAIRGQEGVYLNLADYPPAFVKGNNVIGWPDLTAADSEAQIKAVREANWRLSDKSYCINRASVSSLNGSVTDQDGRPRIFNADNGGIPDIGAYEAQLPGNAIFNVSPITMVYDGTVKAVPQPTYVPALPGLIPATMTYLGQTYYHEEPLMADIYDVTYQVNGNPNWIVPQKKSTLTVSPIALTNPQIIVNGGVSSQVYSGTEQSVSVTFPNTIVPAPTPNDWELTYTGDRINAGTYTAAITMKRNYSGTKNQVMTITRYPVQFVITNPVAPKGARPAITTTPSITGDYNTSVLVGGPESDPADLNVAGTYNVYVSIKSNVTNYSIAPSGGVQDVLIGTFTISADVDVSNDITISSAEKIYNGEAQLPGITLTGDAEGGTATVTYRGARTGVTTAPTQADIYTVTVTLAKTGYFGSKVGTYEIKPFDMTGKITLVDTDLIYNGQPQSPKIVFAEPHPIMNASDSAFSFEDLSSGGMVAGIPIGPGQYAALLTMKNNFIGSASDILDIGRAPIRYVTQSGSGLKSGKSWLHAADSSMLQSVFDKVNDASAPVREVRIAAGTYSNTISGQDYAYQLQGKIKVRGGFLPDSDIQDIEKNKVSLKPATAGHRPLILDPGGATAAEPTTIEGIWFENINSTTPGAVVYYRTNSNSLFDRCKVLNNKTTAASGCLEMPAGMINIQSTWRNCDFVGNSGAWGAVYTANADVSSNIMTFESCRFAANTVTNPDAGEVGQVSVIHSRSTCIVTNSLFVGHTQPRLGIGHHQAGSLTFTNCTIANNANGKVFNWSPTVQNTVVWNSGEVGAGNFSNSLTTVDPLFNNSIAANETDSMVLLAADWSVKKGSPAINWGKNTFNLLAKDITGKNDRIYNKALDGRIDIGAYESAEKGVAKISITDKTAIYDGTVKSARAVVDANETAGLIPNMTYIPENPVNAGSYNVTATLRETELNWVGSGSDSLVINRMPISSDSIRIIVRNHIEDGQPHGIDAVEIWDFVQEAFVATENYTVTYNGGTTVPSIPGIYRAVVTLTETNITGASQAIYEIESRIKNPSFVFPQGLVYNGAFQKGVTVSAYVEGTLRELTSNEYTVSYTNSRVTSANPNNSIDAGAYTVRVVIPTVCDSIIANAYVIAPLPTTASDVTVAHTLWPSEPNVVRHISMTRNDGKPVTENDYLAVYKQNGTVVAAPMLSGMYDVEITMSGNYSAAALITAQMEITNGAIRYVTQTGDGNFSGANWANAAPEGSINTLLENPNVTRVNLAKGTYTGISSDAPTAFNIPDGKQLAGGYDAVTGLRNITANETILTVPAESNRRVGYLRGANALLEGVTVTGGRRSDVGGVVVNGGTVRFCRFINNENTVNGGGAIRAENAKVVIENCYFFNNRVPNSSGGNGGAIQNFMAGTRVYNCIFENNIAFMGSAIHTGAQMDIDSCIMVGNVTGDWAAISIAGAGSTIKRCRIINNKHTSGAHGAGVRINVANVLIENCLFANNSAGEAGGIMIQGDNTKIKSCTFVKNAGSNGGAIRIYSGSGTKIYNSVFWGNQTDISGAADVQNCAYSGSSGTNLPISAVENTAISSGPNFIAPFGERGYVEGKNVDMLAANWRQAPNSALNGHGSNVYVTGADKVDSDLDGNARIRQSVVDIGAYESDAKMYPLIMLSGSLFQNVNRFSPLTVTTIPANIDTVLTYNGSSAVPTALGVYTVNVTAPAGEGRQAVNEEAQLVIHDGNLYISQTGSGNRSGLNWDNAADSLQVLRMLGYLSATDTLYVAQGVYNYNLTVNANIIGGFRGVTGETAATRVREDLNGDGVISPWELKYPTIFEKPGAYPVLDISANMSVDGLTVQKGGIGIRIRDNASCKNSTIRDNLGTYEENRGMGVTMYGNSLLENTLVMNNNCTTAGGGSYPSENAGGVSTSGSASNRRIINCAIVGNRGGRAGGIYLPNGGSGLFVYNTLIANNISDIAGDGSGGVRSHQFGPPVTLYNCTIVNNKTGGTGVGGVLSTAVTLNNSIVYGNMNANGVSNADLNGTNCAIGDRAGAFINLSESTPPTFVRPAMLVGRPDMDSSVQKSDVYGANWRLQSTSICINRGANNQTGNSLTDLDGTARIWSPASGVTGIVDIGAYETKANGIPTLTATAVSAVYDRTAKYIGYTANPSNLIVTRSAHYDVGVYDATVTADDPNWVAAAAVGTLTITPASLSNVTFDCGPGTMFMPGQPDNEVKITGYTVVPEHVVAAGVAYQPVGGGTAQMSFPTAPGDYYARFTVTDTPLNYNFSGVDSVLITLIDPSRPLLTFSAPDTVKEGGVWPLDVRINPAAAQDVTVFVSYSDTEFIGGKSITVPAGSGSAVLNLTATQMGVTRPVRIAYESMSPSGAVLVNPGLSVTVEIQKDESLRIRYVTLTGGGTRTGYNWENAGGMNDIATFQGQSTVDTLYIAQGTYGLKLTASKHIVGGFQGIAGEIPETRIREDQNNDGVISPWELKYPTIFEKSDAAPILTVNGGVSVDGVTVQNGVRGVDLKTDATLRHAIVQKNSGTPGYGFASGISVNKSNTLVEGCLIRDNIAGGTADAGSAYCVNGTGAGGSAATSINNIIKNSMIYGNSGSRAPVGLNQASQVKIYNTVIVNNSGSYAGAVNCHGQANSAAFIYNSTIANNIGPKSLGQNAVNGTNPVYANSIIYNNKTTGGAVAPAHNKGVNCAIDEAGAMLVLSETVTPEFINATGFVGAPDLSAADSEAQLEAVRTANWRLKPESLCINRGAKNQTGGQAFDADGKVRTYIPAGASEGFPDMGAYETEFRGTAFLTAADVTATFDGNGKAITYTVEPAGLTPTKQPTSYVNAGIYADSVAFINDLLWNDVSANAVLTIQKATATVVCADVIGVYNMLGHPVSPVTTPAGLNVITVYEGASGGVLSGAPINADTYYANMIVSDSNWESGLVTAQIVITGAPTGVITLPVASTIEYDAQLSMSTLTGGVAGCEPALDSDNLAGVWSWLYPSLIPEVSGPQTARFTPYSKNYLPLSVQVDVSVREDNGIRYVRTAAKGNGSGRESWDNAATDIQAMINDLRTVRRPVRVVYVDSGVYTGTVTALDGVSIYGGFDIENGMDNVKTRLFGVTILNGNGAGTVLTQPAAFTKETHFDKLVLTGGQGGSGLPGGALIRENGFLVNSIIRHNSSDWVGGVYAVATRLDSCMIVSNTGVDVGGVKLDTSMASNLTVAQNQITGIAEKAAAGLFITGGTVRSSVIEDNSVTGSIASGAGVTMDSALIVNCIIRGNRIENTVDGMGAGVYAVTPDTAPADIRNEIVNTVITENTSSGSGAAVAGANVTINQSTIIANRSTNGAAVALTGTENKIVNSILWNADTEISGDVEVSYSVIEGGYEGVYVVADGLLLDAELRPMDGSSSINAGLNSLVIVDSDLDGEPRIWRPSPDIEGVVDAGAYEYRGAGRAIIALTDSTMPTLKVVYDGAEHPFTHYAVTPARAAVEVTYNGMTAIPLNVDTYHVNIAVTDPNWIAEPLTSASVVISPLDITADIVLGATDFIYTGGMQAPVVTLKTVYPDVTLKTLYLNQPDPSASIIDAGVYPFETRVVESHGNYIGAVRGVMMVSPAQAVFVISQKTVDVGEDATADYTVTCAAGIAPPELNKDYFIYYTRSGSRDSTTVVPTEFGTYTVTAVAVKNYDGFATLPAAVIIQSSYQVHFVESVCEDVEPVPGVEFHRQIYVTMSKPRPVMTTLTYDLSVTGSDEWVSISPVKRIEIPANATSGSMIITTMHDSKLTDCILTFTLKESNDVSIDPARSKCQYTVKNTDTTEKPYVTFDKPEIVVKEDVTVPALSKLTFANLKPGETADIIFDVVCEGGNYVSGKDYLISGTGLEQIDGRTYKAANVTTAGLTVEFLPVNSRLVEGNKVIKFNIKRVDGPRGCLIGTRTVTFVVKEMDQKPGTSASPVINLGRRAVTLNSVFATQEGGLDMQKIAAIDAEPMSAFGAAVRPGAENTVIYDYAAASFTVSDSVLDAGIADTICAYADNDPEMRAKPIYSRVYVGHVYEKGMKMSFPFSVLCERSGLNLSVNKYIRTPAFHAEYLDPFENVASGTMAVPRRVTLKTDPVPFNGADVATASLTVNLKLYNALSVSQARAKGLFTSDIVKDSSIQKPQCGMEIFCRITDPDVTQSVGAVVMIAPKVTSVERFVNIENGSTVLRVSGAGFGTTPSFSLEYAQGAVKTARLPLASAAMTLKDKSGKIITLTAEDVSQGSYFWVKLPVSMPDSDAGRYGLVIDSGCGLAGAAIPTE